MKALEFTTDEIKTILEALEHRVTYYKLQHKNVIPMGMSTKAHKKGAEWINRYAKSIKNISNKLEKGLAITIIIKYNHETSRYDWGIADEPYFVYRVGLKDLEETKSWLKNEKLQNPHITFIVDKSK